VTAQQLVQLYEKGAITFNTLLLDLLNRLDPSNPDLLLGTLPDKYVQEFRQFLSGWVLGKMKTNYGPPPTDEQVTAAREWLARTAQPAGV
jgi:hypothetical protein